MVMHPSDVPRMTLVVWTLTELLWVMASLGDRCLTLLYWFGWRQTRLEAMDGVIIGAAGLTITSHCCVKLTTNHQLWMMLCVNAWSSPALV